MYRRELVVVPGHDQRRKADETVQVTVGAVERNINAVVQHEGFQSRSVNDVISEWQAVLPQ